MKKDVTTTGRGRAGYEFGAAAYVDHRLCRDPGSGLMKFIIFCVLAIRPTGADVAT